MDLKKKNEVERNMTAMLLFSARRSAVTGFLSLFVISM